MRPWAWAAFAVLLVFLLTGAAATGRNSPVPGRRLLIDSDAGTRCANGDAFDPELGGCLRRTGDQPGYTCTAVCAPSLPLTGANGSVQCFRKDPFGRSPSARFEAGYLQDDCGKNAVDAAIFCICAPPEFHPAAAPAFPASCANGAPFNITLRSCLAPFPVDPCPFSDPAGYLDCRQAHPKPTCASLCSPATRLTVSGTFSDDTPLARCFFTQQPGGDYFTEALSGNEADVCRYSLTDPDGRLYLRSYCMCAPGPAVATPVPATTAPSGPTSVTPAPAVAPRPVRACVRTRTCAS